MSLERHTRRLIVRPFREDDYECLKESISSLLPQRSVFEVLKRDPKNKLTKKSYSAAIRLHREERSTDFRYRFAIIHRVSGQLLGVVTLEDICRGAFQNTCLGYHIFNQHWGQGFATEAVRACIRIAFEELGFHRVEAAIASRNKRSIAVAKRVGMRYEGLSKKRIFERGDWQDLRIYSLTAEDLGFKYDNSRISQASN